MAFEPAVTRVPTKIKKIRIVLETNLAEVDGEEVLQESADYSVEILDADGGTIETKYGDLVPQLSAGEITALQVFMANQRVKAQTFLPA